MLRATFFLNLEFILIFPFLGSQNVTLFPFTWSFDYVVFMLCCFKIIPPPPQNQTGKCLRFPFIRFEFCLLSAYKSDCPSLLKYLMFSGGSLADIVCILFPKIFFPKKWLCRLFNDGTSVTCAVMVKLVSFKIEFWPNSYFILFYFIANIYWATPIWSAPLRNWIKLLV